MRTPFSKLLATLAGLLLMGCHASGQTTLTPLTQAELAKFPVKGSVLASTRYEDNTGTNYVILTHTGISVKTKKKNNGKGNIEYKSKYIYAYRFQLVNGKAIQRWRITDFVLDCEFNSIKAQFFPNLPRITDQDNNGIKEVWVAYIVDCTGESASPMKIIMYEGKQKYAIRGYQANEMSGVGDDVYTLDAAFQSGPASIRNYALNLWKEYCALED